MKFVSEKLTVGTILNPQPLLSCVAQFYFIKNLASICCRLTLLVRYVQASNNNHTVKI